jgi:hypothetical protein
MNEPGKIVFYFINKVFLKSFKLNIVILFPQNYIRRNIYYTYNKSGDVGNFKSPRKTVSFPLRAAILHKIYYFYQHRDISVLISAYY